MFACPESTSKAAPAGARNRSRPKLVRHGVVCSMAIAARAGADRDWRQAETADQTRPSAAARMRSIGRSNHWLYTLARSRNAV